MKDVFHRSAKGFGDFRKWDNARREIYPQAVHLRTSTYVIIKKKDERGRLLTNKVIELGFWLDREKTLDNVAMGKLVVQ